MKLYHNGNLLKEDTIHPIEFLDDFELSWNPDPAELYTLIIRYINWNFTIHDLNPKYGLLAVIINIPLNNIESGDIIIPYKKFRVEENTGGEIFITVGLQKSYI